MNDRKHSGKYNLFMNYLLQAANFIFPLITFPYVSRVLGAAKMGEISFANSNANYFAAIATFGLSTYAIRTCSVVRSEKKKLEMTAGELVTANAITTIIAITLFTLYIAIVPEIRMQYKLMLIVGMGFTTEFIGMAWLYVALEQFTYITIRTIVLKIISIVFIFLFVKDAGDILIYALISTGVVVMTNVLNWVNSKKLIHISFTHSKNFIEHYKVTCYFFGQSVAVTLLTNMDITMIGYLSESVQVGSYEVATKMKYMASILVSTLGNVFLPRLSQAFKENDMKLYWGTVNKCLSYNLFISLPIASYVLYAGNEIITFFCGKEYYDAGAILKILIVTIVFIGVSTVTGSQVLISMRKEKAQIMSIMLGSVINLILNLMVIPKFGAIGAACTTLIAEIVIATYQIVVLLRKNVKINLWNAVKRPIIGCISAISVTLLSSMIFNLEGLYKLFIGGTIFAGIYIIYMWIVKDPTLLLIIKMVIKDKRAKEE